VRRIPIRVRLTAWYVVVLAVVLTALGAFVVTRLRSDLTDEVDRSLVSATDQIATGYRAEGPQEFTDIAQSLLSGQVGRESGAQILDRSGQPVRSGGQIVADGGPLFETPLIIPETVKRVLAGERILSSYDRGDPERHLRVLAIPVERAGVRGVLVAGASLEEVDDSVDRVFTLVLIGGLASLTLVALGGWWIARKALRPVEEITTRADRIDIDDLAERIPVPRADDEVGHLARTLNTMLARLEEGVATRERFIADASHELRAPLAAMRSELEVSLRQDVLDEDARAVLASTREEVIRMGRIVENLLTLARVDDNHLNLLITRQDLLEIAERTARIHAASAAARGVGIIVSGDPVILDADGDRIEQVLGNLVDNAIRFTAPGTTVHISVRREEDTAVVAVTDEGPGVPAEARGRVFERFVREDPARGRLGGAGLGLAICQEIVNAHGGRIWVEDNLPRGSAFVVALPYDADSPSSPLEADAVPEQSAPWPTV
jgi:two-component system, OmpR family, sensor kinase